MTPEITEEVPALVQVRRVVARRSLMSGATNALIFILVVITLVLTRGQEGRSI